jgi:hypothetical protein
MKRSKAETMKQAGANAVVLDVDLSQWDRRLRIVVAQSGDDLSAQSDVFNLDFIGATVFRLDAGGCSPFNTSDQRHTRWTLWGSP